MVVVQLHHGAGRGLPEGPGRRAFPNSTFSDRLATPAESEKVIQAIRELARRPGDAEGFPRSPRARLCRVQVRCCAARNADALVKARSRVNCERIIFAESLPPTHAEPEWPGPFCRSGSMATQTHASRAAELGFYLEHDLDRVRSDAAAEPPHLGEGPARPPHGTPHSRPVAEASPHGVELGA